MKDHDKKINHYLIKGEFKVVFYINQDCKYIMTGMIVKKNIHFMVKILERSN